MTIDNCIPLFEYSDITSILPVSSLLFWVNIWTSTDSYSVINIKAWQISFHLSCIYKRSVITVAP